MRYTLYTAASLALLSTGCADYEMATYGEDMASEAGYGDTGYYAPEDESSDADWDDGLGSESEDDYLKLLPATTQKYVFVANQTRNTVSRIAVPELEVITVEVDEEPAISLTTADYARAVTLNTGADTVSVIDAETLEVNHIEIRPNLNQMVLSDDGNWAVTWHDPNLDDEETSGTTSYYEISIVNTITLEHFPMVVGFSPNEIAFTPDDTMALVVGNAYLARIDLTVEDLAPDLIQIASDPLDPPEAEEVELTPDGTFAFVRQYGTSELVVVDLVGDIVDTVDVGANPTDLDLSPDGTQAVVVARASQELWILDAADPFGPADVVDLPQDETLGSIQFLPDGSRAVVFTTATLTNHYAVWDVLTDEIEVHALVKPIDTIAVTPTGESLLIFHTLEDAADAEASDLYFGEWALTVTDLDDFRSNAIGIEGEPLAYANSDDGTHGFFVMDKVETLMTLEYSSLLYEAVDLKSVPVHVGVLPDTSYAYVNQEHELGRLSFFDAETQSLQTITGFELNSEIEHY